MSRKVLRLLALLLTALVGVGGQVAMAPTPAAAKVWAVPKPDLSLDPLLKLGEHENRVIHLVNKKRKARDLAPVRWFTGCLDQTSERWATHLIDIKDLVHRDQTTVLRRCDLQWTGETLVRGTGLTPSAAVNAWMASDSHRAVLMKPRAKRAGMAVKIASDGQYYGVLNFGDPD